MSSSSVTLVIKFSFRLSKCYDIVSKTQNGSASISIIFVDNWFVRRMQGTATYAPVSYTHLDVYKRQATNFPATRNVYESLAGLTYAPCVASFPYF